MIAQARDAFGAQRSLASPLVSPAFELGAERPEEAGAREALLDAVMGVKRRRKSSEAIRRGRLPTLSLVARRPDDGVLLGTVRLWDVAVGEVPALLLGPLAVASAHAGLGLGSALMRRAIADAAGHRAILLVGDPEYYERFGFSAAHAADLAMPGPFERRRLLGLELVPGALAGARGLIRPTGRRLRAQRAAA